MSDEDKAAAKILKCNPRLYKWWADTLNKAEYRKYCTELQVVSLERTQLLFAKTFDAEGREQLKVDDKQNLFKEMKARTFLMIRDT